jgi:hypothetical protein
MGGQRRFLTGLALAFVLGGFFPQNAPAQPIGLMSAQAPQKPQPNVLSTPGARFVFGQVSDSGKDQFMLDTWTGRLWRISESGGVGVFLNPVPYRLKDGKYEPFPEAAPEAGRREGGKK